MFLLFKLNCIVQCFVWFCFRQIFNDIDFDKQQGKKIQTFRNQSSNKSPHLNQHKDQTLLLIYPVDLSYQWYFYCNLQIKINVHQFTFYSLATTFSINFTYNLRNEFTVQFLNVPNHRLIIKNKNGTCTGGKII